MIGNLTWNANGTLQTLAITDPLNSANSQTCSYGYDDLVRISSAGCGATWSQTFSFDPFGNISKSGTGTFQPTYNTMNRYQSLPGFTPSYDATGNLLNDSFHQYTWDQNFGNVLSIDTVGLTYDALGRMVEQNRSGNYTQIVYSPTGGKLALMNGQTLQKAFVALPTGATAVYTASGLAYYRHADWLGSSRLATTPIRTKYYDVAYAPFGENYSGSGTTDLSFTGQNQDTVTGLHDFLFREYHPASGRWISPDPAGRDAADLTNPQTWNRYAYVMNNPLEYVDPLGLADDPCKGIPNCVSVTAPYPSFPSWWSFVWQGAPVSVGLDQLFCMVVGGCQPPTQQTNSGGNNGGTPKQKPAPKPASKAANNGKTHGCVGTRIVKGVQGVANITLGELKTAGAIGVGLLGAGGAPETGGVSLSATLGAGYLAVSSQGQVLSGTGQLYSAISGNFQTGEQIQQVGDIISGPISGITVLVVAKNPEAAALAANFESAITLGAGAVNSETVADKIANGVDAALTFLGIGQGSCP